jgi:hypothetical protein
MGCSVWSERDANDRPRRCRTRSRPVMVTGRPGSRSRSPGYARAQGATGGLGQPIAVLVRAQADGAPLAARLLEQRASGAVINTRAPSLTARCARARPMPAEASARRMRLPSRTVPLMTQSATQSSPSTGVSSCAAWVNETGATDSATISLPLINIGSSRSTSGMGPSRLPEGGSDQMPRLRRSVDLMIYIIHEMSTRCTASRGAPVATGRSAQARRRRPRGWSGGSGKDCVPRCSAGRQSTSRHWPSTLRPCDDGRPSSGGPDSGGRTPVSPPVTRSGRRRLAAAGDTGGRSYE